MGSLVREIVILLVASAWRRSHAQLTYTIKATWLDDAEYVNTIASNENRWKTLTENSENLGLTFAGKAEFPWVVDIRVEKKTQEFFSVGNLVSSTAVFTCCRCIDDLGDISTSAHAPRVYYAQMYLFEYTLRTNPTGQDWLFGGTRVIHRAVKHSKCNIQEQYYDGGQIILTEDIHPATPTIGLMKITYDYARGVLPDFDLENMAAQRRVCYVASIGRDYLNIKDHLVKDFKVKYRVYYEQYELCNRNRERMCPNRHLRQENCNIGGSNPKVEGKELMCFQARARVGVVCDHDRGAPLVCDGIVFGLVILGARADRCNDVLQVPFWVQKVTMFHTYFEANVRRSGGGRELDGNPRSSGHTSLKPHGFLMSVIVYVWFLSRIAMAF